MVMMMMIMIVHVVKGRLACVREAKVVFNDSPACFGIGHSTSLFELGSTSERRSSLVRGCGRGIGFDGNDDRLRRDDDRAECRASFERQGGRRTDVAMYDLHVLLQVVAAREALVAARVRACEG